jgi:hypothetical protein
MNEHDLQAGSAKVDSYIAKAPAFAQPILSHIRALVHKAAPEIEETVKWNRPFFLHRGKLLCNMAAFTKHCGFGFWGPEMAVVVREDGFDPSESSGSFGRLASLKDLPPDKKLLGYLRQAVVFAESSAGRPKPAAKVRVPKPEVQPPEEFLAAIKKKKGAADAFAKLAPSCRREYLNWILEAKRPETRERRIETSVEWISEGKSLNWKYENC